METDMEDDCSIPDDIHTVNEQGVSKKNKIEDMKDQCTKQITSGEWFVEKKSKRGVTSDVWVQFGEVKETKSLKFMDLVQCFNCKLVKVFKRGSSTSPLKKHKCHALPSCSESAPVTSEMRNEFQRASIDFCTGDIRPFSSVIGPNFERLIQTAVDLGAKHGSFEVKKLLSDPTTLSRATARQAENSRAQIMPEICEAAQQGFLALTTDLWTESYRQTHYLTVTCHTIDSNFDMMNLVLFTKVFPPGLAETSENIKDQLLSELEKFEIPLDKLIFITDGGANIVKAISLCGIKRIYCIDHCLNIILKSTFTLKLVDIDLFGEAGGKLYDWACLAAAFIKATDPTLNSLLRPPPSVDLQPTSRIFKSKIPFLESMRKNYIQVTNALNAAGQEEIARKLQWDDLDELLSFLGPIERAAKIRGNDLADIDLKWLNAHIADQEDDSDFLSQVKAHLRVELASLPMLELIVKCKSIVTYVKRSGAQHMLHTSLKQDIDIRWNSHLLMLLSFPRNFVEVNATLESKGKDDMKLSDDEQANILTLIDFLQPFKTESEKLEAELSPTIHLVLLAMNKLDHHCSSVPSDSAGIAQLRAHAKRLIGNKFKPDHFHKVAAAFWPDFKHLRMLTDEDREEVYASIRRMINALSPTVTSNLDENLRPVASDGYDMWRDDDPIQEEDELTTYLTTQTGTCTSDHILTWWRQKACRFPKLVKVARAMLGIPASSASSERVFSTAGCVLSSRRTNLKPENVDNILFLHRFLKLENRRKLRCLENESALHTK